MTISGLCLGYVVGYRVINYELDNHLFAIYQVLDLVQRDDGPGLKKYRC